MSLKSSIFARDVNSMDRLKFPVRKAPAKRAVPTVDIGEVLATNILPPLLSPTLPPWTSKFTDSEESDSPLKQERRVANERTEHNGSHIYTFRNYSNGDRSLVVSLSISRAKLGKLQKRDQEAKVKGLGIASGLSSPTPTPVSPKKKDPKGAKSSVFKHSVATNGIVKRHMPPVVTVSKKRDSEKTTPVPAETERATAVKPREAEKPQEDVVKILSRKKVHWSNIARDKKHESDAHRKNKRYDLSVVASIDSLITFVISFNYEDKYTLASHKGLEKHSWQSLVPYASSVISGLEDMVKTPHSTDLESLLGLLYFTRGAIYKHMVDITKAQLKSRRAEVDEGAVLRDLVRLTNCVEKDFWSGETHLPHSKLVSKYTKLAAKRTTKLAKHTDSSIKPKTDSFYLPISPTATDLRDLAAISYNLLKEWCELEKIHTKLAVENSP